MYSHGESNARGVAILAKRESDFNITHLASDNEGRYLVIKITRGDEAYILANIYAPTQDSPVDQINLIDSLEEDILHSGESNVLLGGDFNLGLDPTLDRSPTASGSANRGLQYKERILSLLEGLNLIDVWRNMNPGVKRFTFRCGPQSSRLHHWIISEHLFNSDTVSGMEPEPLSDHLSGLSQEDVPLLSEMDRDRLERPYSPEEL